LISNSFQPPTSSLERQSLERQSTSVIADISSSQLAMMIAEAADDRKGVDIVLLKVSEVSYLAEYFVVVSGLSSNQVRAIARSIEQKTEEDLNRLPLRTEGKGDGSWIVLDYGDVIAHVFMPQERDFYALEAFWGHAEKIQFSAPQLARD
jgi:ribosome-associated protein